VQYPFTMSVDRLGLLLLKLKKLPSFEGSLHVVFIRTSYWAIRNGLEVLLLPCLITN